MSKRMWLTAALVFAVILLVLAMPLGDEFYHWVGVGALVAGVAGLGWTFARWASGRSTRTKAIDDALWSAGNLCVGLFLIGNNDWFILGFFAFVVAATVYRARHERGASPGVEPPGERDAAGER